MSQAARIIKKTVSVVVILGLLSVTVAVAAAYLNTNRDTRKAPEKVSEKLEISKKGYNKIYQSGKYEYYWREDRDIIAIKDKNNGYVWKTGVDAPFSKDIKAAKEAENEKTLKQYAEDEEISLDEAKELANTPQEDSLNSMFTAMANSLVTLEYYEGSGEGMSTSRVSSAAEVARDGSSTLSKVKSNEFKLKCKFKVDEGNVTMNVYITFGEDGTINYKVPQKEMEDDIKGKSLAKVKSLVVTPFLGASGGAIKVYNKAEEDWTTIKSKTLTPGYVLVPDGSGALMRFEKNKAKFSDYEGNVYGADPATNMYYQEKLNDAVPLSSPTMPVYGISHGDGTQAAFVAYADGGDEYMKINVVPSSTEKNKIKYTYAYPSFTYNSEFFQVTNQAGDSYRKVQDKANKFDVDITYDFLSGDGSDGTPSADYVGMAKAYKQHLIDEKVLKENVGTSGDVPIRIDFLMSDSKKGVFSTQEVEVTSCDDVKNIIDTLNKNGVKNINSGLIGWQNKGETLAKPNSTSISSAVGSKGEFEDLMTNFAKKDIDVSFSRDFSLINEDMVGYYKTAASHLNTKYLELDKSEILPKNVPVSEFGYATPESSVEWIEDLYDDMDIEEYAKSFTVAGISNKLVTTYSNSGSTTAPEAIKMFGNVFADIHKDVKLNMVNPNQYLWKYTDRYLQSMVGTSQYVYETDTVPFLQMVLSGTMEVYAPYSNFSFYSKADMLKMIDYNLSPSFVLTKKPSYLLAATTSADYYSTEFTQYKKLIGTIYNTVNDTLKNVSGFKWTNRTVLEDGVIANEYEKDGYKKTVIINYTNDKVTVKGKSVNAQSAIVVEGGVK